MKSRSRRAHEDPLCCCEYNNQTGDTVHVLQCCCDCEALDLACDRFLTCRPVHQKILDDMFSTIEDRLRIPSCSGKGAIKVNLEIAFPVVVVPLGVLLATLNRFMTVAMLIVLPAIIMIFHRTWMRRKDKPRTKLFYIWGLTSSVLMYTVFEFITIGFREILLWENLLLSTMFGVMLYALYHAKMDPGRIKRSTQNPEEVHYKQKQEELQRTLSQPTEQTAEEGVKVSPIGNFLIDNFEMDRSGFEENIRQYEEANKGAIIEKDNVTWVDSRAHPLDGSVYTWCHDCQVEKPPRTGHCKVCNMCIQQRDHHCVWIDNCIGSQNHRAFWLSLVLFELSGIYGAHLTLTTVCTPNMYFDWILLPSDCRFVYSDFPNAISFVSACYSIIAVIGMGFVLLQQCVMISQNITSQECFLASHRGWGCCCVRNNLNNRGSLYNWIDFLLGRRKKSHKYGTLTV